MPVQNIPSKREVSGGCLCGNVRLTATGDPYRVGLCHCLDCRKHHGALFSLRRFFPRMRSPSMGKLAPTKVDTFVRSADRRSLRNMMTKSRFTSARWTSRPNSVRPMRTGQFAVRRGFRHYLSIATTSAIERAKAGPNLERSFKPLARSPLLHLLLGLVQTLRGSRSRRGGPSPKRGPR